MELACPFLRWSYFLFLCSSSWSFALWVWSPASYVWVHCPLAVAVCIPGDSPSPGRRTSIRRSSTWGTTSRIEAYHAHRYIPNLCRWTIWSPKRNLRVSDVLGFNKAVGSCCFFLVLWVDWTGYRSTTDMDAWQTSNMFKFQIKVSVRKEYLDYGLNIQVPKGGEDQFLKLLGDAGTMGAWWKLSWNHWWKWLETLDVQSSCCAYDTSKNLCAGLDRISARNWCHPIAGQGNTTLQNSWRISWKIVCTGYLWACIMQALDQMKTQWTMWWANCHQFIQPSTRTPGWWVSRQILLQLAIFGVFMVRIFFIYSSYIIHYYSLLFIIIMIILTFRYFWCLGVREISNWHMGSRSGTTNTATTRWPASVSMASALIASRWNAKMVRSSMWSGDTGSNP